MFKFDDQEKLRDFGIRLKKLRCKRKPAEICKDLGITIQSLYRYEKGERTPDIVMAKKIADYYGVTLDGLFGDNNITTDDITHFSNITGLSTKAIKTLISLKNTDYALSKIINQLIESGSLESIALLLVFLKSTSKMCIKQEKIIQKKDNFYENNVNGVRLEINNTINTILDQYDARKQTVKNVDKIKENQQKMKDVFLESAYKKITQQEIEEEDALDLYI